MTSLHVICGLGPLPIKNSGYAYDRYPEVPIFDEHWGVGDNLQFYPNFVLFSTLGWDEPRSRFCSGDQIK